ncbi:MAG TPA: hypothetical protein VMY18_00320 [Acidobacteriota bacterium]|nr:hypothetical protein [Acidobacteriota bacterium]
MAQTKKAPAAEKSLVVQEDKIKDLTSLMVEEGAEEHLSQEELELPFLRVAQKGSPQVDEDNPVFVDGLKPGQFFSTVSGSIFGDEVVVQVHGYFRNFIIWKGEKGAGSYSGVMTPEEYREFESKNQLNRDGGDMVQIVDGEEIRYTDTRNFIVTLPEHPEEGIMIYPLSSTGVKVSKKWNSLNTGRRINGRPTKRYATLWTLKTGAFESNGFLYKQVASIKPLGWATPDLVAYGKDFEGFAESIRKQGVRYSESQGDSEAAEASNF